MLFKFYRTALCIMCFFATIQCTMFINPFTKRQSLASIDTQAIYEGLFSPENNIIVIIQNFYVWLVSSIGFLLLIPFYQAPGTGRSFDSDYTNYVEYENINPGESWVSQETLSNIPSVLRNVADVIEDLLAY